LAPTLSNPYARLICATPTPGGKVFPGNRLESPAVELAGDKQPVKAKDPMVRASK
jgi:hypothetical protein